MLRNVLSAALVILTFPLDAAERLFESGDVFIAGNDNIREYRISALIATDKGTRIAVCDRRVDRPASILESKRQCMNDGSVF